MTCPNPPETAMMLPSDRRQRPQNSRRLGWLALIAAGGLLSAPLGIAPAYAQEEDPSAQERALTVISDVQTADADTGIIIATGNVTIRYPSRDVVGVSDIATYYTQEQRIVMEGNVDITQGPNRIQGETVTYFVEENFVEALPAAGTQVESVYVFPSDEEPAESTDGTATDETVTDGTATDAATTPDAVATPDPSLPTPVPTLTPLLPSFNQPRPTPVN